MLYLVSDPEILTVSSQHHRWCWDARTSPFQFLHTNVAKSKVANRSEKGHNFASNIDIKSRYWGDPLVFDLWHHSDMMRKFVCKVLYFSESTLPLVNFNNMGLKGLTCLCYILSYWPLHVVVCWQDTLRWFTRPASKRGTIRDIFSSHTCSPDCKVEPPRGRCFIWCDSDTVTWDCYKTHKLAELLTFTVNH